MKYRNYNFKNNNFRMQINKCKKNKVLEKYFKILDICDMARKVAYIDYTEFECQLLETDTGSIECNVLTDLAIASYYIDLSMLAIVHCFLENKQLDNCSKNKLYDIIAIIEKNSSTCFPFFDDSKELIRKESAEEYISNLIKENPSDFKSTYIIESYTLGLLVHYSLDNFDSRCIDDIYNKYIKICKDYDNLRKTCQKAKNEAQILRNYRRLR